MSDIIKNYLLLSMTRSMSDDTRAIDKVIKQWEKASKYKTKLDETETLRKQAESMIKTLIK